MELHYKGKVPSWKRFDLTTPLQVEVEGHLREVAEQLVNLARILGFSIHVNVEYQAASKEETIKLLLTTVKFTETQYLKNSNPKS